MQVKIMDLNCTEEKFNLSAISKQEWIDLAHHVILAKGERIKVLELKDVKVVVRENRAKFDVSFQDSDYHEHKYHLDAFGRVSRNYQDIVSQLFQDVMGVHYGEEYKTALNEKLAEINKAIEK